MLRLLILGILIIFVSISPSDADELIPVRVTLSHFSVNNDKLILPEDAPYWPELEQASIAIDNNNYLYVLNLWNNEILVYGNDGTQIRKIKLPVKLFRFKFMNGRIEVSGAGDRFYVDGYDQAKKLQQIIFNEKGNLIKKFSDEKEIAWNFPTTRLCNKPYFLFLKGGLLYDENLQQIKEPFVGFSDNEGRYYFDYKKHLLVKLSKDGGALWEKQFKSDFEIIGVDSNNYLYIVKRLENEDPDYLYKLDPKGKIKAQVKIPNPFPLLTQTEKDDFYALKSEEPFASFRLTCNGEVYLTYRISKLPESVFKRWSKGGEFFIYRFESKR